MVGLRVFSRTTIDSLHIYYSPTLNYHQTTTNTTTTMSFNDTFFRPFFQLLDEPYTQQSPSGTVSRRNPTTNFFDDPFFNATRRLRSPAVEINEEGDHYVVEAELPGVRKEDVDVRIGDAGRSLTIEGKSFRRFGA